MIDTEKILKEIENNFYLSLTEKTHQFEEFFTELTKKLELIKEKLNESYFLYIRFVIQTERKNKLDPVYERIDKKLESLQIFGYGFYHRAKARPLYIGVTVKGKTRINQHFQWYSSAFVYFPMYYLDEIKVWQSSSITSENIKRFEDYLMEKLNPYFNKKRSEQYRTDEIEIYEEALQNEISIPLSDFRDLFRRLS